MHKGLKLCILDFGYGTKNIPLVLPTTHGAVVDYFDWKKEPDLKGNGTTEHWIFLYTVEFISPSWHVKLPYKLRKKVINEAATENPRSKNIFGKPINNTEQSK